MNATVPSTSDDTRDVNKCKNKITKKNRFNLDSLTPIIYFSTLHIIAIHGLITIFSLKVKTILWLLFLYEIGCIGITAGAHRLWSHRSYKVNLPLKLIILAFFSVNAQISVYNWVRIHRVHHKYVDTDLDPHNSRRGFFFCHIGWLLKQLKPEVVKKLHEVNMRDILEDPIMAFQKRHAMALNIVLSFILPTLVPIYFWNEAWDKSFTSQVLRVMLVTHASFSINSFAHIWGAKPYDKTLHASENMGVSLAITGEGFHNYHHKFPWDYQASEFNWYGWNHAALFIDMFAKIGWATNLKKPSRELVKKVAAEKGDGSYKWDEVPMCDSTND
ncbi:hypothetical protein PUN28_000317 [Cardiocondyla obscurior]|uniref:Fatty acid desaturase domain-containing protein n=1 Tax=Cardiocondyla obscurior TaxID=286306 RepID=A0AAW2GZC8_9HYME